MTTVRVLNNLESQGRPGKKELPGKVGKLFLFLKKVRELFFKMVIIIKLKNVVNFSFEKKQRLEMACTIRLVRDEII